MRLHEGIYGVIAAILLGLAIGLVAVHAFEESIERLAFASITFIQHGTLREHEIDEFGVPARRYAHMGGEVYFNPVYVGVYGLAYYDRWLGASEHEYFTRHYRLYFPSGVSQQGWKSRFLATADWFVEEIEVREHEEIRFGVWVYRFPWEVYALDPLWISGMAQGLAIQVLLRAWRITDEVKYLNAAELALMSFEIEVIDGGVTLKDTNDSWWFEEYASPGAVESRVLNGMEHSLVALYEMHTIAGSQAAAILFRRGMRSLESRIAQYDAGWWTYYDGVGTLAKLKYHKVNTDLTRKLYSISGNTNLSIYESWEEYSVPFIVREFVRQPPNRFDWAMLTMGCVIGIIISISVLAVAVFGIRPAQAYGDQ